MKELKCGILIYRLYFTEHVQKCIFLSEIPYETEDILYIYINMTLINIVKILDMFSLWKASNLNFESQIQIYYQMMKNIDKSLYFEKEKSKIRNLTSPNMSINIRSSVPMEVTVTNTCLDVLNNLVKVGKNVFYSVQWKCEGKMCFVHICYNILLLHSGISTTVLIG